jgi:hypothetical protein
MSARSTNCRRPPFRKCLFIELFAEVKDAAMCTTYYVRSLNDEIRCLDLTEPNAAVLPSSVFASHRPACAGRWLSGRSIAGRDCQTTIERQWAASIPHRPAKEVSSRQLGFVRHNLDPSRYLFEPSRVETSPVSHPHVPLPRNSAQSWSRGISIA